MVPLIGIVLGNVLNSASLGLDTFYGGVVNARAAIEAQLVLGATRHEALAPLIRDSVRKGLIPIINQMSAAGIITLHHDGPDPRRHGSDGRRALSDPADVPAGRRQRHLCHAGRLLAARSITDERHRLRLERLTKR
jgi:putative ABC transport system permease protein